MNFTNFTEEQLLDLALAHMHEGAWFNWKEVDDNGNKIPNDQRMTLENTILTPFGIAKGYSIPTQSEIDAKIQEIKDAETAIENKKASGKQKLKDLGLDDDEIKALTGA